MSEKADARTPTPGSAPLRARAGARGDTLVLCYHAVSPDWEAPLAVTPENLGAQLAQLIERGYRGVTFSEAVTGESSGNRVAITFDDGYRSVPRLAKPILDAHSIPATVFVPTEFLGAERPMGWSGIDRWLDGPHAEELTPMSWQEARKLVDAGWEIGSHTRTHPRLTRVDDARLQAELEGSRAECERQLGCPCESLAYPYGDVDRRVVDAAVAAGYAAAAAVSAEVGPPSPHRWPRVGIYQVDGRRSFALKVSRPARRLQRSRSWGLLERGVRLVRPKGPAAR